MHMFFGLQTVPTLDAMHGLVRSLQVTKTWPFLIIFSYLYLELRLLVPTQYPILPICRVASFRESNVGGRCVLCYNWFLIMNVASLPNMSRRGKHVSHNATMGAVTTEWFKCYYGIRIPKCHRSDVKIVMTNVKHSRKVAQRESRRNGRIVTENNSDFKI